MLNPQRTQSLNNFCTCSTPFPIHGVRLIHEKVASSPSKELLCVIIVYCATSVQYTSSPAFPVTGHDLQSINHELISIQPFLCIFYVTIIREFSRSTSKLIKIFRSPVLNIPRKTYFSDILLLRVQMNAVSCFQKRSIYTVILRINIQLLKNPQQLHDVATLSIVFTITVDLVATATFRLCSYSSI